MKLTDMSFVLMEIPRSPKFSTTNPLSLAMDVMSSTFSVTEYVGVTENVRCDTKR